MQNAPATEKQTAYIAELLYKLGAAARNMQRHNREQMAQIDRLDHSPLRAQRLASVARNIAAAEQVEALFARIAAPAEMTQARASRWIELFKQGDLVMLDKMLDNPKIAEGFGVTQPTAEMFKQYRRY